ncbi:RDD family protein [Myxococcota bacterium]|nr:RDD family protein [Myxococcota bacterium]
MNPYAPPREAELVGEVVEGPRPQASILSRLLARGIDLGVGFIATAPLVALLSLDRAEHDQEGLLRAALMTLVCAPFTSFVVTGLRWSATTPSVGKSIVGLEVVDSESGAPVSFVRGVLARESLLLIALAAATCVAPISVVVIGYLSWTGRRAPHDWMTDVMVVRRGEA